MKKGKYACPECKAKGVRRVYEYPTSLGVHRRHEHNIKGTAASNIGYRRLKGLEPEAVTGMPCPHCPRTFAGQRWLSKHINLVHPEHGKIPSTAVAIKRAKKGINANIETEEDKANREYAIRSAGFLEGLCHGMAAAKELPPEEFTAGVARYLTAFTIR